MTRPLPPLRPLPLLLGLLWLACNPAGDGAQPPYGFACSPGEAPVRDGDGDGWETPADCDDGDPAIHPGAAETCNEVDDNCNGQIDEFTTRELPYLVIGRERDEPQRYPFTSGGQPQDPEDFPAALTAGDEALGLTQGDLDGDGIPEVVLQSAASGALEAYTIDCDGGFSRRALFTPTIGQQLRAIGDIDGDGDADLWLVDPEARVGETWINDGAGGFAHAGAVDLAGLGELGAGASLAVSQTMVDLDGDGFADGLLCVGADGATRCLRADGRADGALETAGPWFVLDNVEASGVALGWFDDDPQPDLFLGVRGRDLGGGVLAAPLCWLEDLDAQQAPSSASCLLDLADELDVSALSFEVDGIGDGWLGAVAMNRLDEERDELLVVLPVTEGALGGSALLYLPEPLAVVPGSGFEDGLIRPLSRQLEPPTGSTDERRHGAVATASYRP